MKVGDLIRFKRTGIVALVSERQYWPGALESFMWLTYSDPRDGRIRRSSFRIETLKRTAEVINEDR